MGLLTDIAGQTQPRERTVINPVAENTQLCKADTSRSAIGFAVTTAISVTITTDPSSPDDGGFQLTTGSIEWFTVDKQGSFAQLEWWARPGAGALKVTVFEHFFTNE